MLRSLFLSFSESDWRKKNSIHRSPCAAFAAWHQVCVDAKREPRVAVTEVRAQGSDALAGVQQHGGVEVPESVHAVLAGGGVPLAQLGCRDEPSGDKRGRPGRPELR